MVKIVWTELALEDLKIIAERLGPGKTVATIIVDSGLRYISTPLYQSK